ncbi:MAG: amidohydrolase family protein, partial [Acidimicrobiales bacterium]
GLDADGYSRVGDSQARFADGSVDGWIERVDRLHADDGQIIGAAVHSVRAVDPGAVAAVAEWADQRGAPVHAHVSEQTIENDQCRAFHKASPVQVFHDAGVLGERFTAVHATHIEDRDVELLADSGASVCLCPTTERDLGDGIAEASAWRAAGIPITLGSDSHAVIDHFVEARSVEFHERLRSHHRGIHSAIELLSMATGGHASIGWPDVGTIAAGMRADLVAVDVGSVRGAGGSSENALETVVFTATAADVTDVVIGGRHIVRDGRHQLDVAGDLEASISALMDT